MRMMSSEREVDVGGGDYMYVPKSNFLTGQAEKSNLVPRTFIETIASSLGLAPPFGSCVYADVVLRFPG